MTNRNNDDIANALRGLASGEHVDPEAGGDEAAHPAVPPQGVPLPPPVPAPLPPSPRTAPPPPAAGVPALPKPVQPKPPGPSRPARPIEPGAGPAPRRAAAPGGTNVGRPPGPPTRPVSPAPGVTRAPAPGAPSFNVPATAAPPVAAAGAFPQRAPTSGSDPTAPGEFVHNDAAAGFDEDDAMNMPAPSAEYLAHVPHPTSHPKRPASGRPSGLRETLIPVLLTTAVLMLAAAVLKFVVHPDAPLAAMPTWLALILAAASLAFAGVAVVYVMQARRGNTAAAAGGGPGGQAT